MIKRTRALKCINLLALSLIVAVIPFRAAWAGLVTGCTPETCTWEISVDGNSMMSGMYMADPDTGDIILADPVVVSGSGFTVSLEEMNGNIDPILGFSLSASNTSGVAKTFSFAFSLPMGGLPVPISTYAEMGTTLTALTDNGGSVFATLGGGNIVDSQDIVINPYLSVDKGVDIGAGLSTNSKGTVLNFENASGFISSGGPYDLMSVTVAFGLTDQTSVGMTGFVEQTAVPVPAAVWLFASGLIGLAGVARRRK